MRTLYSLLLITSILLSGCSSKSLLSSDDGSDASFPKKNKTGNGKGRQAEAGVVTAGEWNDLNNWEFYKKTLAEKDFSSYVTQWQMYTNHRIAVMVKANDKPVTNVSVTLLRNDSPIWRAKTDNLGRAELWVGAFQKETELNTAALRLTVNEQWVEHAPISEKEVNIITLHTPPPTPSNVVQLAFMVDATGSMSDELEFLKMDLQKVIGEVEKTNSLLQINTATIFYRDKGDEYVVRQSGFTNNIKHTIDFIGKQEANGGGDFPEAVDKALEALNSLEWNANARTRIAFMVLDAPPHKEEEVIKSVQTSVQAAASKGIKLIPIVASGIDKSTEFLMRFMAIYTNGTYVFITNDSGIGNNHIKPSVGEYQVEKLSNLMVRLIKKYSE